jgi:hypothetical protein
LINPCAVFAAITSRGSVEIAIIAFFRIFSNPVATFAGYPFAMSVTVITRSSVTRTVITLLSGLQNIIPAFVGADFCGTVDGARIARGAVQGVTVITRLPLIRIYNPITAITT